MVESPSHQPALLGYIGAEDGGKLAFVTFVSHMEPPRGLGLDQVLEEIAEIGGGIISNPVEFEIN